MKRLVIFFILSCLLQAAYSQQDQEADHEALREIRRVFEKAVAENDMEQIRPYLAKGFSIVTFTDREFHDFDTFLQRWEQTRAEMLHGGTYTVDLQPERSVIMNDIALCRGNSINEMTTGSGKSFTFTAKWTAICCKENGQWRILRGHNSLDPFHNPMLVDGVKSLLIKSGAFALLAGLAIGIASTCWVKRRRSVGIIKQAQGK